MKRKIGAFLLSVVFIFGLLSACADKENLQRFDDERDILRFADGSKVQNEEDWQKRRKEILDIFAENVYGEDIFSILKVDYATSEQTSDSLFFEDDGIVRHRIRITVSGGESGENVGIDLYLFRDMATQNSPKPVILHLNFKNGFNYEMLPDGFVANPAGKPDVPTSFAAKTMIAAGFHVVTLNIDQVAANMNKLYNLNTGVFRLAQPGKPSDAKTIGAWAWGASRAVDYLYARPYIDKDKIAVIGHSRGGKAALWAGANDERISAVISNNSGCTGAAMSYDHKGETIRDINEKFPYWFCDIYKTYNDKQNELSFDQHMLLATIAPRLLYVASSSEDGNADPENELWAARLAGDAYKFLGKKPLSGVTEQNLELNKGYHDGDVGYHRKEGRHSLTYGDWLMYLAFFKAKGWVS